MSTFNISVQVGDPDRRRYQAVDVLVDTGASYTTMPAGLLNQLGVEPIRGQRFVLANGVEIELDLGQTWLKADGREQITIVVFGDEDALPLLGAVTLEEMGLGVDTLNQRLIEVPGLLGGYR